MELNKMNNVNVEFSTGIARINVSLPYLKFNRAVQV